MRRRLQAKVGWAADWACGTAMALMDRGCMRLLDSGFWTLASGARLYFSVNSHVERP